jgi:AmiR/NasT family two-component response regulator
MQGIMDYKLAYKHLFNAITDALSELEKERVTSPKMERAKQILMQAQQNTENMFIESATSN